MSTILIFVHVIVCIALIMIVLLQTGKGADMGAAFGGGSSQTLFGSTGASTFLSKATTVVAIVFMLTSLVLAYIHSHQTSGSVVIDSKVPITTEREVSVKTKEDSNPVKRDATTNMQDKDSSKNMENDKNDINKTD